MLRDVITDLHSFTQAVVSTDVPSINTFLGKVTDSLILISTLNNLALILQTLRYTLELINKPAHPARPVGSVTAQDSEGAGEVLQGSVWGCCLRTGTHKVKAGCPFTLQEQKIARAGFVRALKSGMSTKLRGVNTNPSFFFTSFSAGSGKSQTF